MNSVALQGRKLGAQHEGFVADNLQASGWDIVQSAELDHAKKTDMIATCPNDESFPLQISAGPKSKRQTETLTKRGVESLAISNLNEDSPADYICRQICQVEFCDLRD